MRSQSLGAVGGLVTILVYLHASPALPLLMLFALAVGAAGGRLSAPLTRLESPRIQGAVASLCGALATWQILSLTYLVVRLVH